MKIKSFLCLTVFFILLFATPVLAQDLPEPTRVFYVADFANVMSSTDKDYITAINLNYEKTDEKPQIVVVTTVDIGSRVLEEYSVELFEKWGIGNSRYDNGVLIILSLDPNDRSIRMEIGYGLEGRINDALAGRILDNSMEDLNNGEYSEGLVKVFRLAAQYVNDEYGYDDTQIFGVNERIGIRSEEDESKGMPFSTIFWIIFIIGLLWADNRFFRGMLLAMFFRNFFGGGGRSGGGFGGGGSFGGGGRSGGGGASRRF